jgi:hypothetical protein
VTKFGESPRPDSNRLLPCTRRVLDLSSCMGSARGARRLVHAGASRGKRWIVRVKKPCVLNARVAVECRTFGSGLRRARVGIEPTCCACRAFSGERSAPAEGIEPSNRPVNSRLPDHSASLEYCSSRTHTVSTDRPRVRTDETGAKFSESEGLVRGRRSGHRIRTCLSGFRDQRPAC